MITAHLVVGLVEGEHGGDEVKYIYVLADADQAETFQRMAHPNVTKSDVIEWQVLPTLICANATDALKLHQEEIKDDDE
jgi:hypothetical protein